MKKSLLLLLATSALLFTSCQAVNPANSNGNNNGNGGNNNNNNNPPVDDDPEFVEFNLLDSSSTSDRGRDMMGKGIYETIDSLLDSSALKITGNIKDANIDLTAKEDSENPRYNVHENIKDISGKVELGLSGYSFKKNQVTSVNGLIGYIDVDKLNATSNLTYQLSNELLKENSTTTTTVNTETKSENGKAAFYLKEGNVYGDLSDENITGLLETVSKVGEVAGEDMSALQDIADKPKFKVTSLLENKEVNLYNVISEKIPVIDLLNAKTISGALESLAKNAEGKESAQEVFDMMDIKFYSAIQKSDYYFKITFGMDEVSDFITLADYISSQAEEGEEGFTPIDIEKDLEEMDIELVKSALSGEIRFAKTGDIETDIDLDLEMNYKDEIDLTKYEDFKVDSLSVDSNLKFSSSLAVKVQFEENKSYADKLPSDEELADYYEIDGAEIKATIEELIEKYSSETMEEGQE